MKMVYRIFAVLAFISSVILWNDSKIGNIHNIPCMFESLFSFISGWGFTIMAHSTDGDAKLPKFSFKKAITIIGFVTLVASVMFAAIWYIMQ